MTFVPQRPDLHHNLSASFQVLDPLFQLLSSPTQRRILTRNLHELVFRQIRNKLGREESKRLAWSGKQAVPGSLHADVDEPLGCHCVVGRQDIMDVTAHRGFFLTLHNLILLLVAGKNSFSIVSSP